MSDTTKQSGPAKASPMRMLRRWLFVERGVRGLGAIELDVVERQVAREEKAVGAAAGEAARIERRLHRVRETVKDALTDELTPGVIDPEETRKIARELLGVSVSAHHHKRHLEALT